MIVLVRSLLLSLALASFFGLLRGLLSVSWRCGELWVRSAVVFVRRRVHRWRRVGVVGSDDQEVTRWIVGALVVCSLLLVVLLAMVGTAPVLLAQTTTTVDPVTGAGQQAVAELGSLGWAVADMAVGLVGLLLAVWGIGKVFGLFRSGRIKV